MDTGRGTSHSRACWGVGIEGRELREWGGITWGEMPDIGDGGMRQQATLPGMYLCNNPACSAHAPQNLKYN